MGRPPGCLVRRRAANRADDDASVSCYDFDYSQVTVRRRNEVTNMTDETRGFRRLRLFAGFAANIAGLLCVIWPVLPRQWGVGDPSMGIQYMFFWMMTVPLGAGIAAGGTYFANGSWAAATVSALAVGFGGVHFVFEMAARLH